MVNISPTHVIAQGQLTGVLLPGKPVKKPGWGVKTTGNAGGNGLEALDLLLFERLSICQYVQVKPWVTRKRQLEPELRKTCANNAAAESLMCKLRISTKELLLTAIACGKRIEYVVEKHAIKHAAPRS